jgi:hypothetical protein
MKNSKYSIDHAGARVVDLLSRMQEVTDWSHGIHAMSLSDEDSTLKLDLCLKGVNGPEVIQIKTTENLPGRRVSKGLLVLKPEQILDVRESITRGIERAEDLYPKRAVDWRVLPVSLGGCKSSPVQVEVYLAEANGRFFLQFWNQLDGVDEQPDDGWCRISVRSAPELDLALLRILKSIKTHNDI